MTYGTDILLTSLWRASWQGALAFVSLWLISRMLARRLTADTHCWLWRLGYIKLCVGLIWGGAILLPLLSPLPNAPLLAMQPPTFSVPRPAQRPGASVVPTGPALPAVAETSPGPQMLWRDALAVAYGIGVAICLVRLLLAARRTRHVLYATSPAGESEAACAEELARRLGLPRVPPLARSATIVSPVLVAGRILLPAHASYEASALRMILAHELAHARRRDLMWEWLGTLVQVAFFFHPLVVLARREERLAREAAADALALRVSEVRAADYGRLLLSLALGPRLTLIGAVGVVEGGTPLRRRLLALRDGATPASARRSLWRAASVLVPLMALTLVPWQVTHGQAQPSVAPATPAPVVPARPPNFPAGDKRVVGIIRDEAGKPVGDLTVGLEWETKTGSGLVGQAVTDAQGRFAFSKLPQGNFLCQVWSEEKRDSSGHLIPLTVAQDTHFILGGGALEKDLSLVVSTGTLVTGRVVNAQTGKPVAGIYIDAGSVPVGSHPADWETWSGASNGTTDAQGRYLLRVMPGNVFVRVLQTSGGYLVSERVRPAERAGHALRGQTASLPDISVSFNPMIVFTGPDGQPVANTPIRITPADMGRGSPTIDDHTDEKGAVVLSYYESGSFSLSQNGLYASGTYQWSPGHPLVIQTDGQTLTFPDGGGKVQLTAGSSATVTGYVVSEDETPIPNALVTVYESDPKSHYGLDQQVFRTDASGNFHAPLDPSGEYQASVRADGFNQVMVSKKPLSLAKGQPTHIGTIHLIHAGGFVSGRIVDQSGKPMPGLLAAVQGQKTGGSAALTDAQGRFHIPNIVPGESLHLTLCLHGGLENGDSGSAMFQDNKQMDLEGVTASPTERQIIWHPHSGGY